MTGKTTIEWATAVWNPTTGCTRVSAGCDNCYAFALHDKRYASNLNAAAKAGFVGGPREGNSMQRNTKARAVDVPLPWPRQYDLPFSRVQLLPDRLDAPLRRQKPERYFVDSMSDLFHEKVPDEYIAQVFAVMAIARRHTFLILTKRPERMRAFVGEHHELPPDWMKPRLRHVEGEDLGKMFAGQPTYTWPYPNVWLGTSVEDQAAADERIPQLARTPAAVRFLSCEPLIGAVDLRAAFAAGHIQWGHGGTHAHDHQAPHHHHDERCAHPFDWVIIGGESGPRARPMDLAWARSLVEQCRVAGVAPFVKQLGSKPTLIRQHTVTDYDLRESHGRDMTEWPDDLRIREWPRGYTP